MFLEVITFDNTTVYVDINKIVAVKNYDGHALLYLSANIYKESNSITLKHTQEEVMDAIRSATGKPTMNV